MTTRPHGHFRALLLLLLVSGCGGPLVQVSGRVTYKGQPVPSTYVKFWPQEEGQRYSIGLTDDNGRFTLRYSRTEMGVLPGQHTVFLTYHVSTDEELGKVEAKASREVKAAISRYGDLTTSPLHYEISSNGQFIDICLE